MHTKGSASARPKLDLDSEGAWFSGWATSMRSRGLDRQTRVKRLRTVSRFVAWLQRTHGRTPDRATARHIEEWVAGLGGCGHDTRALYLSGVRSYYRWAVTHGVVEADPTRDVIAPRRRVALPRPIPVDELEEAWRIALPRERAWIALAALCGLRCVDMAGIRAEDLLVDADGMVSLLVRGKGRRERKVPVPAVALEALRAYGLPRRGWVFPGRGDSGRAHVTPGFVSARGNEVLRAAGSGSTMHTLRHWYASSMYAETRDPVMLQRLLGHAGLQYVTVYADVEMGPAGRAAERVAGTLGGRAA